MMACETWTPCGPNSFARLWDSARKAHLPIVLLMRGQNCNSLRLESLFENVPVAKEAMSALLFTEAVAPVKISEGGCSD